MDRYRRVKVIGKGAFGAAVLVHARGDADGARAQLAWGSRRQLHLPGDRLDGACNVTGGLELVSR